jgi:hypothetical protein
MAVEHGIRFAARRKTSLQDAGEEKKRENHSNASIRVIAASCDCLLPLQALVCGS